MVENLRRHSKITMFLCIAAGFVLGVCAVELISISTSAGDNQIWLYGSIVKVEKEPIARSPQDPVYNIIYTVNISYVNDEPVTSLFTVQFRRDNSRFQRYHVGDIVIMDANTIPNTTDIANPDGVGIADLITIVIIVVVMIVLAVSLYRWMKGQSMYWWTGHPDTSWEGEQEKHQRRE